jgi:hypothetical protein
VVVAHKIRRASHAWPDATLLAGEPRSTVDIDFVAALAEAHIPALVSARCIIRVQGPQLDRNYLALNAPVLGVADLLARALGEGKKLAGFPSRR